MTTRVKKISSSLQEVKDSHRFLKVSMKDGKYNSNRVQIAGYKTTWAKNPDVVYSPETGLAGIKGDIIDFLKSRRDKNDDSVDEVLTQFENNPMITSTNQKEHLDYIEKMSMKYHESTKSATGSGAGGGGASPVGRISLIDRELIPDFLNHVREVRSQTGVSGKSSKTDIIQSYLEAVRGTDKVYRIHGCDSTGKAGESKLRTAIRAELAKTTIPLADSGDLSYFVIPAEHDEKRYVINFMTLYFAHVDGLKPTEASTKARSFAEDLLAQYKKGRGRKSSPKRSTSHKSRSSSVRDTSLKAKRSSSVKSVASGSVSAAVSRERSVSRSRATSVPSRSPSVSPKRTASAHAVARHPSKSPVRSGQRSAERCASPGTSPVQATTTKRFRLPVKTKPTA